MGGFNPIKTALGPAGTVLSLATKGFDINNSAKAARASYAQSVADTAAQRQNQLQQLALQSAQAENARKDALKRTLAKQRAAFGGEGLSASDGSGEAVMLGLFDESRDQKNYRDQLDNLRTQSINQDADSRNRRSLLTLDNARASSSSALFKTLI